MNSIIIEIPEEYEIDKENSTSEKIKLIKKEQNFEYVDLGLPSDTLWATCNVGADCSDDFGKYLTFEEACKYNLPKCWQFRELIEECKWEWNSKLKGYTVLGLNGNFIFLPAAGYRDINLLYNVVGFNGSYWSYTLDTSNPLNARYLNFVSGNIYTRNSYRYNGLSVRPVFNTKILK